MNKQELQFLLNKYGIHPRREQGQNFLIDSEVIDSIIHASELTPDDVVLEIGPGFGILTTALADTVKRVVAVEQDRNIFPAIVQLQKQYPALEAYNQSIQEFHLAKGQLEDHNYKLISNLPYSITSWVLRAFLENPPKPSMLVVMVQKEVAQRVIAEPGHMSVLACAVQLYGEPEIVRFVSKNSFYPQPEIDSAVLRIRVRHTPLSKDPEGLMRIIKIGFAAKRKKLSNNLSAGLRISVEQSTHIFSQANIPPNARAQELTIDQWENIRILLPSA